MFENHALASIHASAVALQKVGAVDQTTMRKIDAMCLPAPVPLEPNQIRKIRERAHMSQRVFAWHLNTSEATTQKWESGSKQPSGMALKLLAVVQKHGLEVLA